MASRRALMRFSTRSATTTTVATAARRTASLHLFARIPNTTTATAATARSALQSWKRQGIAAAAAPAQIRQYSADQSPESKIYDFHGIKTITSASHPNPPLLIDVREPHEFAAGAIPTARNMPVASAPDGIFLPADEFEERFGFEKPDEADAVVFYCKAGVRSASAAMLAKQAGYTSVGEYKGSWADWMKNGGEVAMPESSE